MNFLNILHSSEKDIKRTKSSWERAVEWNPKSVMRKIRISMALMLAVPRLILCKAWDSGIPRRRVHDYPNSLIYGLMITETSFTKATEFSMRWT